MPKVTAPMAARGCMWNWWPKAIDVGGLKLDFSNDNQGSDLVISTYLNGDDFNLLGSAEMNRLLR